MRRRGVHITLGVVCTGSAIVTAVLGYWWAAAGCATVGTVTLLSTPRNR